MSNFPEEEAKKIDMRDFLPDGAAKQIAKEKEVSHSLVSLVLKGEYKDNFEIKERAIELIKEHGEEIQKFLENLE